MPASDPTASPGQLEIVPRIGSVALAGSSYLVYPRERHGTLRDEAGVPTVCLVVRNASSALRSTLRRLVDASAPPHHVVIVDGGSDDWSLSDAIAHASAHEHAIVYQSPRATPIGALYAAALELVGGGTSVLTPLHPELAHAALVLLPPALEHADDILGAIPAVPAQLVTGGTAAGIASELMALRGPVDVPAELARCTTAGEVSHVLGTVLRRGHCAVVELPAIAGWAPPPMPADTERTLATTFWPGVPALRLGQDGAFTFLVVTPWDRDAGWAAVVEAYVRTFSAADAVSLAVVVVGPDVPPEDEAGAEILAVIARAHVGSDEDVPDISLHTTPTVLEHLPAIYTGSQCLVVTGEARWADEAMASGIPVIGPLEAGGLGAAMAATAADPGAAATRGAEARRDVVRRSAVDEQALERPEQSL